MKNIELHKQYSRIKGLLENTPVPPDNDFEIMSHWAKYLCVIIAGFLENSLKELLKNYSKVCSSPTVNRYCSKSLEKIQNPKTTRFIDVLRQFDNSWANYLENFVQENGRKEAIDSIMANRHLIAHGKSVGLSVANVKRYFNRSVEVVDFIEEKILVMS